MPSRILIAIAGFGSGLLAVAVAFEWARPQEWGPDLVVGWTFIGCGLVASARQPSSGTGRLLVATGFAWFLGNFAALDAEPIAWLAAQTRYLHRGLLIHLLLSFPSGQPSTRLDRAGVVAGYLISISPIAGLAPATVAVGAGLLALSAHGYYRAVGPARSARRIAMTVAAPLGLVLMVGQLMRLLAPTILVNDAVAFAHQVVLVAVAVGLLVGLVRAPWERTAVIDLVVELTGPFTPDVRAALARALGDPTLDVAYVSSAGGFVDATGKPVQVPEAEPGRAVTPIELDGGTIGVLLHDAAVLEDDRLATSIAEAVRLLAENARLQAELRARITAVQDSRHRLVTAGAEEQRLLQRRLLAGAGVHLEDVRRALAEASTHAAGKGDDALLERLSEVVHQLKRTQADLDELARGLHPTSLHGEGLDAALRELADRSAVTVSTTVASDGLPPDVTAAAYYVCAEAIANVTKHAEATTCTVSVDQRPGWLVIAVADDGVGGADPTFGSGLLGLADRVEALGGRFKVVSPPGGGTRLSAELPLGGEHA